MNTNIQGLNHALEVLDRKIALLDRKLELLDIQGGNNILVSRNGSSYTIDSIRDEDSLEEYFPWKLVLDETDTKGSYKLSTKGGTVNGLLPDNFMDITTVDKDTNTYVYWEADTDGNGVSSLTIKTSASEPNTNIKFMEEGLPTKVLGLVGYIDEGNIAFQFIKNHITIAPRKAYELNDSDQFGVLKSFFTWEFSEPQY